MSHNKSQATTTKNRARLMQLLQDPANKHCADCKTSKNPRWASWNLGMFICIRCSGIHRSLGTHITRVKSVDLDSWTDEQTDSMCSWGNKRANAYWEHSLKPRNKQELELGGYVPLDGKVESFVRTKYVLGKWKDDGPRDASRYSDISTSTTFSESSSTSTIPAPAPAPVPLPVSDPLSSLLDFGQPKSTPISQSASTSSLLNPPVSVSRSQTNPTISLLEQHSSPSFSQGSNSNLNSNNQNGQAQNQRNNNRPDLKKSILSLYSTPAPSASNISLNYGNKANSGSSSNSTLSNAPLQNSSIWGNTSTSASIAPAISQTKNLVGDDDPFKNVWN
jgi:stromal membrane-associated protein